MRITYAHVTEAFTMNSPFNASAPKKPTNVSINSDLLEKARALDINLSATLEVALAEQVRNELRQQWKAENAKAMDAYNTFIEEHGVFSDGLRQF
jgi:antitoxin CcdA